MRKWHEIHLEWWPGVHCTEEGWGWEFCQRACMILQKLKRNLGTKRKISDLGIGRRIEIIRSWSYKSLLKTNWEGPECLAIDFVKTWGRELIVRVWVRAEQDSNRWIRRVVYTYFQFVSSHLLWNPLCHTTKATLIKDYKWSPCCDAFWTMSVLFLLGLGISSDPTDHSLLLKVLSSLDFQKMTLSWFFSCFIGFSF